MLGPSRLAAADAVIGASLDRGVLAVPHARAGRGRVWRKGPRRPRSALRQHDYCRRSVTHPPPADPPSDRPDPRPRATGQTADAGLPDRPQERPAVPTADQLHPRWRDAAADEVERLLGVMSAKNPMVGRFVPIPKREGHYDRERLELAIRHGFCIVRWTPQDASARETIMRESGGR
jgi:hypothetical protein